MEQKWIILLLISVLFATAPTPVRAKGHLDGTGEIGGGVLGVAGWSCRYSQSQNIEVALYAGAPKDAGGRYVTHGVANRPREAAVGEACGVRTASNFGFILELTSNQRQQFAGQRIFVHAVSGAFNGLDELLSNSGVFTITPPPGETLPRQTIVLHPFTPGGDDGDAEVFTQRLIDTFGPASSWHSRYLGFVLLLNPLQEDDQVLADRIKQAFAAAKKHQIRLLIHLNHEWLFGFFPDHDVDYGNKMIEQITGVRPLHFNSYRRVNAASDVLDNCEWTSWSQPLDQFILYWGSESIQPPRINFRADGIRNLLRAKSQVIISALAESFAEFFPSDSHLFLGIDLGWETSIDDQDIHVPIGFGALKKLGYGHTNLPLDINEQLRNVAIDFLDFGANLYRPLVGPNKMFSHYLLLDQDQHFPGYNYQRWERNPAQHAWMQNLVPGFSIYCLAPDCQEVHQELRQSVQDQWAITEVHPANLSALIDGLPEQDLEPPLFITIYAFGANVVNDSSVVAMIRNYLLAP